MIKTAYKKNVKESFWACTIDFAEALCTIFPDCKESKDMLLYTKNIVKGDSSLEEEGIESWYKRMMEPLNTKKVKYAKSIERIIKSPAVVYHAFAYKDGGAIQCSTTSERLAKLNFGDKMKDERMKEEDKEVLWKFLSDLNKYAAEYLDKTYPSVPTRDEIQKNIQQSKKNDTNSCGKASMMKGFTTALSAFNASRKQEPLYDYKNDDVMKSVMSKWTTFSKQQVGDSTMSKLCSDKDERVVEHLKSTFDNFDWTEDLSDTEWNLLNKLFSFCAVDESIPTNMMGTIESMANSLADDIVNGKKNLSDLDLNEIGQQVLSQVNAGDVNEFANNIHNILPAITKLQQQ
jgi:hypothetical protein